MMNPHFEPCEKCILPQVPPKRDALKQLPRSLKPLKRFDTKYQQVPWLPEPLYICTQCQQWILFVWRPRDDYFNVMVIPSKLQTLFEMDVTFDQILSALYDEENRSFKNIISGWVVQFILKGKYPFKEALERLIEEISAFRDDEYRTSELLNFFQHVLNRAYQFQRRYPGNDFSIQLSSVEPLLFLTENNAEVEQIVRKSFIDVPRDLLSIPKSEKQALLEQTGLADRYRSKTIKKEPFIDHGPAPFWRSAILITIGVLAGLVVGFGYGAFGGAYADYVISLFCAAILGATIGLASKALKMTHFPFKFYAGLLSGIVAVGYGHYIGYHYTFKDGVYFWLQHEASSSYTEIKKRPKETAVQAYMARVLDKPPPHGFFSSLHVRAIEGTEVTQLRNPNRTIRKGIFMWFGWVMNAVIIILGGCVGAVISDGKERKS
jgi:hypothetical protein